MPSVQPTGGKGLPRSLSRLYDAIASGIAADELVVDISDAAPTVADVSVYESQVRTSGSAGNEILQLPAGAFPGARHLVTFAVEGNAADVVRVNAAAGEALTSQGQVGDTPAAITNLDLDTPGEFGLFEYDGDGTWNLLYTTGATS